MRSVFNSACSSLKTATPSGDIWRVIELRSALLSFSGSRTKIEVSCAAVTTNSLSVSKVAGSDSPSAGAAATCVPLGTTASTVLPSESVKVSGARAGCGGVGEAPSKSRKARKFFSGTLFKRSMSNSA